jgi:SAM-dependent methyltransferase
LTQVLKSSSIRAIKKSYVNLVRFPRYLVGDLRDCGSILDLGCGSGTLLKMGLVGRNVSYTGLDVFRPYLKQARRVYQATDCEWIQADVSRIPLMPHSFDAVVAFEVLEHVDKNLALDVLLEMEKIARRKVLIIVPNGMLDQSPYDGNRFQIHRSSWLSDDFERLGYRIRGIYGLKQLRGDRGLTRYRPHILWEFVSDLSQVIIQRHSEYASHLYAVKSP